jgi:hypothetical protein
LVEDGGGNVEDAEGLVNVCRSAMASITGVGPEIEDGVEFSVVGSKLFGREMVGGVGIVILAVSEAGNAMEGRPFGRAMLGVGIAIDGDIIGNDPPNEDAVVELALELEDPELIMSVLVNAANSTLDPSSLSSKGGASGVFSRISREGEFEFKRWRFGDGFCSSSGSSSWSSSGIHSSPSWSCCSLHFYKD